MQKNEVKKHLLTPQKSLLAQLLRYAIAGGIAFAVDFCLLWLITDICHAHYLIGAFCGYTAGLIITYLLSIKWVFDERRLSNQGTEFIIFTIIGVSGLLLTQLLMYLFTEYLFGSEHYLYSKLITTVIVSLFNFVMKKLILFTKSH